MNGLGAKTDKGKTGCVGWKYTYRETENESRAENLSLSSLLNAFIADLPPLRKPLLQPLTHSII
jgi:hypothetical protein